MARTVRSSAPSIGRTGSLSVNALHGVRENVAGDLPSHRVGIDARTPEMNSTEHPCIAGLLGGGTEARVVARHAGCRLRREREFGVVTEERRQYCRRRSAERGMARWIFRMVRRGDQRSPGGI